MNVNSYIYQSPSTQSVQFGRPDPSAKSSDSDSTSTDLGVSINQSHQDAQNFQATQVSDVKAKVDIGNSLDLYA